MKPSTSHYHDIRGLRYHVRTWGKPSSPLLVLLHGWMDVGASFQFLVDALRSDWYVVAPDWRGFGLSEWSRDPYWFPDYYADLDFILDQYAPSGAVRLVGHSMGGNIACTYCGIRPERVETLVSMEGFGSGRFESDEAHGRYVRWLKELREPPTFRSYSTFDEVADRIRRNSPYLTVERAQFLARHWAHERAPGEVVLVSDPKHRLVNPVLWRIDEVLYCWKHITAPTLWIQGEETKAQWWRKDTPAQFAERTSAFRDFRSITLPRAGHMMHHDQPEELARILEPFLLA
jgi:pimeloyl-ACP methyl ester carboxylesterase